MKQVIQKFLGLPRRMVFMENPTWIGPLHMGEFCWSQYESFMNILLHIHKKSPYLLMIIGDD